MTVTSPIPRPLRGSRIDVFYPVKEENVPSLSSLDSAFQLQEYISLVIRLDVHDVDRIVSIPAKTEEADSKVTVDESCWIYEQLRRLAQDLTHPLITNLQNECTRQTCPEMKAGEWLYLCVAHGNDGGMEQCCAIDYILHTIDSATALLNSPRAFPSRIAIPAPSYRHFASLARRLGRIFAHAYFHHRALFEQAEAESSLYRRFEEIVARWNLVPREFLVIPNTMREDPDVGRGEPKLAAAAVEMTILSNQDKLAESNNASPPSEDQSKSPGSISPGRRFGRNRTDTMVFSEASALVEELSKSPVVQAQPEAEVEAEVAGEEEEDDEDEEQDGASNSEDSEEPLFTVDEIDRDIPLDSFEPTGQEGEEEEGKLAPTPSDATELPVISPSSSTAPSDPAPQDVHVVALDDPPKEALEVEASEITSSEGDSQTEVAVVEEAQVVEEPRSDPVAASLDAVDVESVSTSDAVAEVSETLPSDSPVTEVHVEEVAKEVVNEYTSVDAADVGSADSHTEDIIPTEETKAEEKDKEEHEETPAKIEVLE